MMRATRSRQNRWNKPLISWRQVYARRGCGRPNSEDRGGGIPELLSVHPPDRSLGQGGHSPDHLPPGAGRGRYRRWVRPRPEWPLPLGVRHAARARCGERLSGDFDRIFGFDPDSVYADGPPPPPGRRISAVQLRALLRIGDEVRRADQYAGARGRDHAPGLCRAQKRPARAGAGRDSGGCGAERNRRRPPSGIRAGQGGSGAGRPGGRRGGRPGAAGRGAAHPLRPGPGCSTPRRRRSSRSLQRCSRCP